MTSLSQLNLSNSTENNFDINLNNTNVLSLNNNGNIGIGTSANSSDRLIINGNINATSIGIGTNSGNTIIAGRIGIGTTNPSSTTLLTLSNSISANNTDINFINNLSSNAIIGVGGSTSTSLNNASYQNNFFIHARCNIILNANSNNNPDRPHLFILSNGNIGIGTITVSDKLTINGNINAGTGTIISGIHNISSNLTNADLLTLNNQNSTYTTSIKFTNNASANAFIGIGGASYTTASYVNNLYIQSPNSLIINTGGNTSASNLYISPTGGIGIGTGNGIYKLNVNGSFNVTGDITGSSTLNIGTTSGNIITCGKINIANPTNTAAILNVNGTISATSIGIGTASGNTIIAGRIGIGTTNPSTTTLLTLSNSISANNTDINFINNLNSNAIIGVGGSASTSLNNASYQNNFFIHARCNIILNANTNNDPARPHLFILSNGNIGIGTSTNLTSTLNVNGSISASNLTLNNELNLNYISLSYPKSNPIIFTGLNNYNYSYINNNTNIQYNYSFTSSGTLFVYDNITCDILLVGGGGGSGAGLSQYNDFFYPGGGGGGGYVNQQTNINLSTGTYNITIGTGGTGASYPNIIGTNGYNTSFTGDGISYLAGGGGGGGSSYPNYTNGTSSSSTTNSGGGGGGSHMYNYNTIYEYGNGASGNGYSGKGGNANMEVNYIVSSFFSGGGGGGVINGDAPNASSTSTSGGIGFQTDISGQLLGYGGGGAGGYYKIFSNRFNSGNASDGGGNFTNKPRKNSGGGGGSLGANSGDNGADGIVIIKFSISMENNNLLKIKTFNSNVNTNINFINNINSNTIIGIGGSTTTSLNFSYSNNFFIHANCNIIFNAGNNTDNINPHLFISRTGNIGIGTSTNLISKLNINNKLNVGNTYITDNFIDFTNNNTYSAAGRIKFGASGWQITSYADIYYNTINNSVSRLDFYLTPVNEGSGFYFATNTLSSYCGIGINAVPSSSYSIVTDRVCSFAGSSSSSDERIKTNIISIDKDETLKIISKINPVKYEYIDKNISKTYTYGLIAQELDNILPNSIIKANNYIPNIYTYAIIKDNTLIFNSNLNIDKNSSSYTNNIKININSKYEYYKIKEINSNNIILNENINDTSNCFVYGLEVNDFHNINYNNIFTLNISAIQKLYEIIQNQQEQINILEKQFINI